MDETVRDQVSGDESIMALFSRVVADAESLARAEVELQKAKVFARVGEAQNGVIFLLAAAVTGLMAFIALVVGALMILSRLLGPGWATVIVVGLLLLVTGVLGWLAIRHFKLLFGASRNLP